MAETAKVQIRRRECWSGCACHRSDSIDLDALDAEDEANERAAAGSRAADNAETAANRQN
ncbi:MAG: hypothetical protein LBS90_08190 [Oscillospiraceae bacterium]|nr:hypothetical protein [Oscillospiraceae bacterium]